MSKDTGLSVEERLFQLLQHLGIKQAHFAAHLPADWRRFAATHPEMVASLILASPPRMDAGTLTPCSMPLLVFTGDQGPVDEIMQQAVTGRADATLCTLAGYSMLPWADIVAERRDEIGAALVEFLARVDQRREIEEVASHGVQGEVAGLPYYIVGEGTPLILLPLGLAPSRWEPLIPTLSEDHCVVVVQGSALGYAAILETRGRTSGYQGLVRNLVNEVHLHPGEKSRFASARVLAKGISHIRGAAPCTKRNDKDGHVVIGRSWWDCSRTREAMRSRNRGSVSRLRGTFPIWPSGIVEMANQPGVI